MIIKFRDYKLLQGLDNSFIVNVNPFLTNDELIPFYYYAFWFPGYFGFNWDAFDDCMKDLEWINADVIYINHDVMINLSDRMIGFYANTLNSIASFHRESMEKEVHIVFSEKQRDIIMANYNYSLLDVKNEI